MFSCKHCRESDPSTDTVKVSFPPSEDQRLAEERAEAEARRRAEEAAEEEDRRLREEEAARERAMRLQEEMEAEQRRVEAEERKRLEAQRRAEEEAARHRREELARQQREREEAERAEEARRQEAARKLRQSKVAAFLKSKGFASVTAPKKSMLKTIYAIHVAAEAGDTEMVQFLIEEGADPAQKNSGGKTAAEVAKKKNKKSSQAGALGTHDGVLRALGGA